MWSQYMCKISTLSQYQDRFSEKTMSCAMIKQCNSGKRTSIYNNLRWKQWKTVCPEGFLIIVIAFFRTQYMVFKTQMPIQDRSKPPYILSYTVSEWKRKSKFMKTKMKWTMQQFYAKRVSLILYSLITRNSLEWGKWLCCR